MTTKRAIRNLYLPLPQGVYEALRAEAAALRQPAADLDPSLESAALELLRGRKLRR